MPELLLQILDVLVVLWLFVTAVVGLVTMIWVWVGYGVDDSNTIRVALKSLRGFIWPVWAILAIRKYVRGKFREDWQELFPPCSRPESERICSERVSSPIREREYSAGQWRDL